MESKSTHLEWRQLVYRREKGMTISLKRGSLWMQVLKS
ncbi:hypothetical protein Gotri_026546 [Gossypium trilobum]|uniref:Uncharacterized protein n=1 Tax=Gossypium trilobum TaxID=34281 RepID=A0A7J9FTL5_9ROSI|nr:hypothetical protein [Gossypium trilobum]